MFTRTWCVAALLIVSVPAASQTVLSEADLLARLTADSPRARAILATADVDGDGRKDLVIRTGPSTLSVHKGTAEGIWAKGTTEISIPAVGKSPDVEGYVADLTGDKKDDFVLLYKAPPGGVDRTVVVISP